MKEIELTKFIREMDVLKQWPLSRSTLIRARKNGLPFNRIGAFVCYLPADLEAYFCRPRSWQVTESKGKEKT